MSSALFEALGGGVVLGDEMNIPKINIWPI